MKISYNWLKQFINTDWEAEKTGELLTDLGLEIEGIEPCGGPDSGFTFPTHVSFFEKYKEKTVGDRLILHFQGEIITTNPANGRQAQEKWNSQVIFDFKKGLIYNPGTPVRITGEDGRIAIAAGRLVIDMNTGEIDRAYAGIQWPEIIAFPDPDNNTIRLLCEDLMD